MIRKHGAKRAREWGGESGGKSHSVTVELPSIRPCVSIGEGGGIPGVGVKSVDIGKNTGGEGATWTKTDAEVRKRG